MGTKQVAAPLVGRGKREKKPTKKQSAQSVPCCKTGLGIALSRAIYNGDRPCTVPLYCRHDRCNPMSYDIGWHFKPWNR